MDKLLDLTRDFDAAKAAFEAYLDEYDRADDKIHLKIVHTYGVVDAAEDIARRMGLGEEDVQLADYADRKTWAKKMLVNIAKAGFFSSDRTIEQYNNDIWHLTPAK